MAANLVPIINHLKKPYVVVNMDKAQAVIVFATSISDAFGEAAEWLEGARSTAAELVAHDQRFRLP